MPSWSGVYSYRSQDMNSTINIFPITAKDGRRYDSEIMAIAFLVAWRDRKQSFFSCLPISNPFQQDQAASFRWAQVVNIGSMCNLHEKGWTQHVVSSVSVVRSSFVWMAECFYLAVNLGNRIDQSLYLLLKLHWGHAGVQWGSLPVVGFPRRASFPGAQPRGVLLQCFSGLLQPESVSSALVLPTGTQLCMLLLSSEGTIVLPFLE